MNWLVYKIWRITKINESWTQIIAKFRGRIWSRIISNVKCKLQLLLRQLWSFFFFSLFLLLEEYYKNYPPFSHLLCAWMQLSCYNDVCRRRILFYSRYMHSVGWHYDVRLERKKWAEFKFGKIIFYSFLVSFLKLTTPKVSATSTTKQLFASTKHTAFESPYQNSDSNVTHRWTVFTL